MRQLFLAGMLLLAGCAGTPKKHVSVHDFCLKHADRFKDYDECYAETKASRAEARARAAHQSEAIEDIGGAFQKSTDAMKSGFQVPKRTETRCHTEGGETVCETE